MWINYLVFDGAGYVRVRDFSLSDLFARVHPSASYWRIPNAPGDWSTD
jgi:hypothetical protein